MVSSGYFDVPFGVDGTLTTVPDGVQPDGSVSYTQGYGVNYTLQPGTAGALNVDNGSMNQLFYDITLAIQNYQQNGIPPFITSAMNNGSPFSYAQYAQVLYEGVAYQSNISGNTDTPPSSKWNPISLSSPNQFVSGLSTGSANAQVLSSLSPAAWLLTSINGQSITFTAGFTNTGSTTLAITAPSVSATVIKKVSGASLVNLTGGEIVLDAPVYVTWDLTATCWVLNSGPALGTMASLNVGNNMANDTNGNAIGTIPSLPLSGTSKTFQLGQWGGFLQRLNSGTAMTDTLPGTSGAMPAGWYIRVENVDSSAADTIGVGAGGGINQGIATLTSIVIEPGEVWITLSQGSGGYIAWRESDATYGNCQFVNTSTTVCTLKPFHGNMVTFPSRAVATIPSAGITTNVSSAYLEGTGGQPLVASTLYYAYLAQISGSWVIDWSATAYTTDAASGIVVKNGDNTRVLVGMAYINAGPVFADTDEARQVLSWFNRQQKRSRTTFTSDRSTASTGIVELNSEIRNSVLNWSGQLVEFSIAGSSSNNGTGANTTTATAIGFNGTSPEQEQSCATSGGANYAVTINVRGYKSGLSEALNYATLLAYVDGNTGTWHSANSNQYSLVELNLLTWG